MKTRLRHSEYVRVLLEKRKSETRESDKIHETGKVFTSPPGATSLEENKIIKEYIELKNLQSIAASLPNAKKQLLLKKFFKMKRNQEVIIYSKNQGTIDSVTGKVSAVGRDFVMLTNLMERIWIPYQSILSANIPPGVPNYENTHQNYIYDNDLKRKLITNFGEEVARRDVLIQQFFEESLESNLNSLQGVWIKAVCNEGEFVGQIISIDKKEIVLKSFSNTISLERNGILRLYSLRLLRLVYLTGKRLFNGIFRN